MARMKRKPLTDAEHIQAFRSWLSAVPPASAHRIALDCVSDLTNRASLPLESAIDRWLDGGRQPHGRVGAIIHAYRLARIFTAFALFMSSRKSMKKWPLCEDMTKRAMEIVWEHMEDTEARNYLIELVEHSQELSPNAVLRHFAHAHPGYAAKLLDPHISPLVSNAIFARISGKGKWAPYFALCVAAGLFSKPKSIKGAKGMHDPEDLRQAYKYSKKVKRWHK